MIEICLQDSPLPLVMQALRDPEVARDALSCLSDQGVVFHPRIQDGLTEAGCTFMAQELTLWIRGLPHRLPFPPQRFHGPIPPAPAP